MKRKQLSKEQIIGILQEHIAGMMVKDLIRQNSVKHGIAEQIFSRWKAKFGGM